MLNINLDINGKLMPVQALEEKDLKQMGISEEEFYNLSQNDLQNGLSLESLADE